MSTATAETVETKWTEARLLELLRRRHAAKSGDGPEWAYLEHVRDRAGFEATRTIDAMALGLWPSRGHELHAFEVKVSRSDWRRELADPAKAEAFCKLADRFWVVAPRGVVPVDEVPETWGLLETHGTTTPTLRVTQAAPKLEPATGRAVSRGFLACLLRAAGTGLAFEPDAITKAREEGRAKGVAEAGHRLPQLEAALRASHDRVSERADALRTLEQALTGGAYVGSFANLVDKAKGLASAVDAIMRGDFDLERARQQRQRAATDLERLAAQLRAES